MSQTTTCQLCQIAAMRRADPEELRRVVAAIRERAETRVSAGRAGGVGAGCARAMAVAVGGPGGAWVGVGSSRQATGVTPGGVLGVLAASSVTRAAFGAHADAIDAHDAMTAQSVLRMQSPKSTLSPESREKQVIDNCWCALPTNAGDCCCDPPQGR